MAPPDANVCIWDSAGMQRLREQSRGTPWVKCSRRGGGAALPDCRTDISATVFASARPRGNRWTGCSECGRASRWGQAIR